MSGFPPVPEASEESRAATIPARRTILAVAAGQTIEETPSGTAAPGGPASWLRQLLPPDHTRAPETLICSLSPDRKIGSLYFDNGTRIRTTHRDGPARNAHRGRTLRFNVDERAAHADFRTARQEGLARARRAEDLDEWLAARLAEAGVRGCPAWATPVVGPEMAFDAACAAPPRDVILFEVFASSDGALAGWHSSRGTAARLETDRYTVSVLHAALDQLARDGISEPGARNQAFYDFVACRVPDFAARIRRPEDV